MIATQKFMISMLQQSGDIIHNTLLFPIVQVILFAWDSAKCEYLAQYCDDEDILRPLLKVIKSHTNVRFYTVLVT